MGSNEGASVEQDEWESATRDLDLRMSVRGAAIRRILVDGGDQIRVSFEKREMFVALATRFRTREVLLNALRCETRGAAAAMCSDPVTVHVEEFEEAVCGPKSVDVDLLKSHGVRKGIR